MKLRKSFFVIAAVVIVVAAAGAAYAYRGALFVKKPGGVETEQAKVPELPAEPENADDQLKGMYAAALAARETRVKDPTYINYMKEGLEWKTVGDFATSKKNAYYVYAAYVYDEAGEKYPEEWVPWLNVGNMFKLVGEFGRAEQAYKKAAEGGPARYEPLEALVQMLIERGAKPTPEIIAYFNERFPKLTVEPVVFVMPYAQYLLDNGEYEEGLTVVRVAADTFPAEKRLRDEYEDLKKYLENEGLVK